MLPPDAIESRLVTCTRNSSVGLHPAICVCMNVQGSNSDVMINYNDAMI